MAFEPNSQPSTLGPIKDLQRMSFHPSADHVQENVNKCMECYQICQQQILHSLQLGGAHAEASHIQLLQDCAAVTAILAKFMLRSSTYLLKLAALAREICLDCARDCEKFDDQEIKACAEVCQSCADMILTLTPSH